MVSISKSLYINSKDQLYKIVEGDEYLSENNIFIPFMDSMRDHYYGCRCDADRYNDLSNQEYNKLNNDEVINILKNYFNCNEVKFIK